MEIRSGTITALYVFDVAEQTDLRALQGLIGGGAAPRLTSKSTAPAYLQYQTPPLVVEGESVGAGMIDGFRTRFKFFDYGVVSLSLVRPFAGTWDALADVAHRYIDNAGLEAQAEAAVRALVERGNRAMVRVRASYLAEDYLVASVHALAEPVDADGLLALRGRTIAQLLRGEGQPLSRQEAEEVLRNRLSYLANDLVVPTWNAAFVYDTESGAAAAVELFEFANSQLLEFRYYDMLLDGELARIYPQVQRATWWRNLFGGGTVKAANHLHSVFIELNELTDRTENALKIVGDIYAARIYSLIAARLGLARWKASVEEKLKTLDDISRFAVDQVSITRGQFLELTIVLILILELILFFLGIMR
ncbi:MAG TPA: hypothetical protein VF147_18310 [Vicinamibacterales bacterium]